ncbi:hypothetical protein BGZ89_009090 [Linnemannia elongata]|nr:hypothetical protein BGZ89_009090 [Linnemannia elongata]
MVQVQCFNCCYYDDPRRREEDDMPYFNETHILNSSDIYPVRPFGPTGVKRAAYDEMIFLCSTQYVVKTVYYGSTARPSGMPAKYGIIYIIVALALYEF